MIDNGRLSVWLVDHYDSFSFNVADWLYRAGLEVRHVYWDEFERYESIYQSNLPCVFSPGPKSPNDVIASVELMRRLLGKVPVLGVCLGHQMLGTILGGTVAPAKYPRHGRCREVFVSKRDDVWRGLGKRFHAAAYNSLAVKDYSGGLESYVAARSAGDEIEALVVDAENLAFAVGFQFHPESFLTDSGHVLAKNWVEKVMKYNNNSLLSHQSQVVFENPDGLFPLVPRL